MWMCRPQRPLFQYKWTPLRWHQVCSISNQRETKFPFFNFFDFVLASTRFYQVQTCEWRNWKWTPLWWHHVMKWTPLPKRDPVPLFFLTSLTLFLLPPGFIKYKHVSGETGNEPLYDDITFVVSDKSIPTAHNLPVHDLHITILPIDNQAPRIVFGNPYFVNEGSKEVFTLDVLSAVDRDTALEELTFHITKVKIFLFHKILSKKMFIFHIITICFHQELCIIHKFLEDMYHV